MSKYCDDSMEHNEKAIKGCKGRSSECDRISNDYAIKSKKTK